jgi:hypothetical protein
MFRKVVLLYNSEEKGAGQSDVQRLKRKGSAIANVEGDVCKAASRTWMPSFNLPCPRSAIAKLLTAYKAGIDPPVRHERKWMIDDMGTPRTA